MNLNILPGMIPAGDVSSLTDAAASLDEAQLSSAFAQLLSARFAPTGKNSEKQQLTELSADEKQTSTLSRNQLNELLAAFQGRDGLLATTQLSPELQQKLQPMVDKLHDTETQTAPTDPLDAATLQVLFAMLPTVMPAPQPIANGNALTTDAAEQPTTLTSASSLLSTLTEGKDAPGKPQQHIVEPSVGQSTVKEKLNAKADATVSPAEADTTPLKLASETHVTPHQQTTINTAAVAPVSSPVISQTPTSAMVSAPSTPLLNAQLGSPEWQQALSQQVLMFHRNGQQSAELRLHPQELGALQITLKLDDSQAQLHIASAHSQVRAAVEAAMPQLRHQLAESGINLGQSSVGSESMSQQAQQQASNGHGGQSSYHEQHGGGEARGEVVSAPAALQAMARSVNGVDIFA